jgi:hypothetical protein
MTDHLDLDALADVLATDAEPPAHLADCPRCTADLAELRTAQDAVRERLAALPDPPMPDGLADRIAAALAAESAESKADESGPAVVSLASRRSRVPSQWLAAAAAAVLVIGGAAFGISQLSANDAEQTTAARDAGAGSGARLESAAVRNDSGNNYTDRASLAAAVPALLAGTAQRRAADSVGPPAPAAGGSAPQASAAGGAKAAQVVDPLARLRDAAGLADCLLALLPPDDPSVRPLALDYSAFRGTPALVVLLPGATSAKLDVFVVGPQCSRTDDSVLFYTSVDSPEARR